MGLIFLSAMATSIAGLCGAAGRDEATALGTSLLAMTLSTFLVGLGTLAVGELGGCGVVGGAVLEAVVVVGWVPGGAGRPSRG